MPNFPIGIGTTFARILTEIPARGIAGFSNGRIAPTTRTGGVALLEGLRTLDLIPASVVGIQVGRGATISTPGTGQLTLGGSNPAKYQTGAGNLVKVRNTATTGTWELKLANAKVSGRIARTSRSVLLDTGNNHIRTKKGDAQAFHSFQGAFQGNNGFFALPCDPTKIPEISFTVGSLEFPINPVDIIGMGIVVDGQPTGSCLSLIQDHDDKPGQSARTTWSLGIPFLKNVYQILDSDANTITLAKLV